MSEKKKTVVIELRIRMLREYPWSWDAAAIEDFLNESSHCLGNEIRELADSDRAAAEKGICDACNRTEAKYLRDATEDEILNLTFHKPKHFDNQ